jgi:hypothetical protein
MFGCKIGLHLRGRALRSGGLAIGPLARARSTSAVYRVIGRLWSRHDPASRRIQSYITWRAKGSFAAPLWRPTTGEKRLLCLTVWLRYICENITHAGTVKTRSKQLTTCRVATDGSSVGLEFVDCSGSVVTVELPFEQAEALVMTLPRLLARALRQQTGDDDARYVFGLREWAVESTKDQSSLITTLKTTDGFEVSFGIPVEASRSLGWTLQQGAEEANTAGGISEAGTLRPRANLN